VRQEGNRWLRCPNNVPRYVYCEPHSSIWACSHSISYFQVGNLLVESDPPLQPRSYRLPVDVCRYEYLLVDSGGCYGCELPAALECETKIGGLVT
jgi:hypothetical protein